MYVCVFGLSLYMYVCVSLGSLFTCTCVSLGSLLRYNFFKGCPKARTCTIILRGGAEQFMEETERSLHDAIMIVRRSIKVG